MKKKVGQFVTQFPYFILATLFLMSGWISRAVAQDGHSHMLTPQQQSRPRTNRVRPAPFSKRCAKRRAFQEDVAQEEHYSLLFGCVSGPDAGAMGLHFLNGDLLNEVNNGGVFDPTRPQIVLYEPTQTGVCDWSR